MSKFKKGDAAYVSVASPKLKGQKVTIVYGPMGTGDRAYYQVEDKDGTLHNIEARLFKQSSRKAAPKKKAAPAKAAAATKAKPKTKAKAKPAAKAKPVAKAKPKAKAPTKAAPKTKAKAKAKAKAKDVKTACLPLFDEDFKKFENQAYEKLKKARMKDVKTGKVTLRELQSSAYKTAYKQYYGK
jgi:hypothetical protein